MSYVSFISGHVSSYQMFLQILYYRKKHTIVFGISTCFSDQIFCLLEGDINLNETLRYPSRVGPFYLPSINVLSILKLNTYYH